MPDASDTIVALSTPRSVGALGLLRLSGSAALAIARKLCGEKALPPRESTLVLLQHEEKTLDQSLVTFFKTPHSFTGEDMVEFSCHGSLFLLDRVFDALVSCGARPAEPGEFSLRAYLNGKMDLVEAEALNDLIRARTTYQAQTALAQMEGNLSKEIKDIRKLLIEILGRLNAAVDFVEENVDFGSVCKELSELEARLNVLFVSYKRGQVLREGVRLAIVGPPNAGKSTLFNRLLGEERAIVTEVPGTTRDVISEQVSIGGIAVTFLDTAGLRGSSDCVEAEGIRRSEQAIEEADLILCILDPSRKTEDSDLSLIEKLKNKSVLYVENKHDLPKIHDYHIKGKVSISAKSGDGMNGLLTAIEKELLGEAPKADELFLTQARHRDAVEAALTALQAARNALSSKMSEEFPASDLRDAAEALGELIGEVSDDEVLDFVFGKFCIGK